MAYDKAVDSTVLETGLRTIGNAIRVKGGTDAPLEFPEGFAAAVDAISGGGGKKEQEYIDGLITGAFPSGDVVTSVSRLRERALANTSISSIRFTAPSLDFTNAKQAFAGCTASSIFFEGDCNLSKCREVFLSSKAKEIIFAKNAEMGYQPFELFRYSDVKKIHFGSISGAIAENCFIYARSLDTVIIKSSPPALSGSKAFDHTLIAEGNGYIYVPTDFVDQYKVATNWADLAGQIRAIEDYPEITGAGG